MAEQVQWDNSKVEPFPSRCLKASRYQQKFVCSFCDFIHPDLTKATCRHRFCRSCVDCLVKDSQQVKCPGCIGTNPGRLSKLSAPENEEFDAALADQPAICVYPNCEWTGKFRYLRCHTEGCTMKTAREEALDKPVGGELSSAKERRDRGLKTHEDDEGEPCTKKPCPFGCPDTVQTTEHMSENQDKHMLFLLFLYMTNKIVIMEEAKRLRASIYQDYIWRIEQVSHRWTKLKSPFFLRSPSFEIDRYMFDLKLYPHGDPNNPRTHVGLFLRVIPGSYDAILSWPMNKCITLELLDQIPGHPQHIRYRYETTADRKGCFHAPNGTPNKPAGSFKFCEMNQLYAANRNYINNDTLFIRVAISNKF